MEPACREMPECRHLQEVRNLDNFHAESSRAEPLFPLCLEKNVQGRPESLQTQCGQHGRHV